MRKEALDGQEAKGLIKENEVIEKGGVGRGVKSL